MKNRTTMASLSREVISEADAYHYLENLRWGNTPVCAHCASVNVRLIPPTNGISRKTAGGSQSQRRVWRCANCGKQFSVITNTMMHATKVSIRTWLLVILDMVSAKNGIAAREVERKYGVCPRTAWHMLHRIRQAMNSGDWLLLSMRGTIAADETYIGGRPANRHASDPRRVTKRGRGTDKTPVLSLVNVHTGEVRSRVMAVVNGDNLAKVMSEQVAMSRSHLETDELTAYIAVGQQFVSHERINHKAGEYKRGNVTTNMTEGFFSQLKRSVDGTHHRVSVEHLDRYLGEFDFRYTTCKMSDFGRMRTLIGQMDGRLSYKRLSA